MKNKNYKAFTLVELIVVITILAVLATVAFISFQGYTSSSRDSVRLADLKNISKSFEINRTKGINFPLPDKKVDISSSGTIFQYQGELSQNILEKDLNIFDGGIDPLTGDNYGYAVNSARNKFQIIGFLENQDSVANISLNTTLADNSDKYVKSSGDTLGILLDETTNEVIVQSGSLSEIDIENNTENFSIILDEINSGDSNFVKNNLSFRINQIESCRSILLNGNSNGDGKYMINPTGIDGEEFEVYCDMNTDGGGWTIILSDDISFSDDSREIVGQITGISEGIPSNTLESGNHRIISNWPKYKEFKLQTLYSNGFEGNQRINNTGDFGYIGCDLISFVISYEQGNTDYQDGKCGDDMFNNWEDTHPHESYYAYRTFNQYNNIYNYYGQRTYLGKIIKTKLFRTAHVNSDLGWIDLEPTVCAWSWATESCRTSQSIMQQHENTIKRAIFSIR